MASLYGSAFEDPRLGDAPVASSFTPESEGPVPHHPSPPKDPMYFADFCARMTERYALSQPTRRAAVA